jgi:hypothetical protein
MVRVALNLSWWKYTLILQKQLQKIL